MTRILLEENLYNSNLLLFSLFCSRSSCLENLHLSRILPLIRHSNAPGLLLLVLRSILARMSWNVCISIRELCAVYVCVIAICWRLLCLSSLYCFPFPFHLMLSSPRFHFSFYFSISNSSSIWTRFFCVRIFLLAPSSCFTPSATQALAFFPQFHTTNVHGPRFFIVIKMEIEHNDMQSRFIHFISISMFVFLVAFSVFASCCCCCCFLLLSFFSRFQPRCTCECLLACVYAYFFRSFGDLPHHNFIDFVKAHDCGSSWMCMCFAVCVRWLSGRMREPVCYSKT